MKQKLLLFTCCLFSFSIFSQEINVNYAVYVNQRLFDVGDSTIRAKSLSDLHLYADQGDSSFQNLLGLLYREGLGVEKNEDKAFELISKAALKELPAAEFNLGRFYMIGLGCDIDFTKAVYWLTLSADHGNERAAYSLGYMHFKGFGVEQDYKKAISWFELSQWSMAKHYLGICYFFGYGVEKDEEKAIIYFSNSKTVNSKLFLKHIAENVSKNVESELAQQLSEIETQTNTAIHKEVIDNTTEKLNSKELPITKKDLKSKYLNGKWKGKLVEFDYSKTKIVRILPISCEFTANEDKVHYKWYLNKKTFENEGVFEDNALYFNKLDMIFDIPYSENPNSKSLIWQLLSSQMEFKTVNKKVYLVGNLQTFSNEWQEPGPPMYIILKQTEEGVENLSEDDLVALNNQKEHFITLYPNPFVNDVLIEYELEKQANVSVDIYDLSGNSNSMILQKDIAQTQGKYQYTIDGSKLKSGMYIVRVLVGNTKHSRILIKN